MRRYGLLLLLAITITLTGFACSTATTSGDDDPSDPDAGVPGSVDASVAGHPDAGLPGSDATPAGRPVAACFEDVFVNGNPQIGPDYDQFNATVGTHCQGTNNQDLTGIERVVVLGDSVTVGTPPTLQDDFYRSRLADQLVERFGLDAPDFFWKGVNIFDGTTMSQSSGDFASCSEWGARTDDLIRDGSQIEDCFPVGERDKRTLVIMTIGGNDIASITSAGLDGEPIPDIWAQVEEFVQLQREAVQWFYDDPQKFPNGVFVIFANMFEFTDGTGETTACPAAGLAGFGAEWEDQDALADMVVYANEQFASIAMENGADMIFILENFCGHGFNHDDPTGICYRGPGTERWFDDTCIHPNPVGHDKLADMFMAVVDE